MNPTIEFPRAIRSFPQLRASILRLGMSITVILFFENEKVNQFRAFGIYVNRLLDRRING